MSERAKLAMLQDDHFKNHCVLKYFSHFVAKSCCLDPSMWFFCEYVKDGVMHL